MLECGAIPVVCPSNTHSKLRKLCDAAVTSKDNSSEKTDEDYTVSFCQMKRKRLRSIRVRNALRNNCQEPQLQKSQYFSTSEDSNDTGNLVLSDTTVFSANSVEEQNQDYILKKKRNIKEVGYTEEPSQSIETDRLNSEQFESCSNCTECEDLNENGSSEPVRKKCYINSNKERDYNLNDEYSIQNDRTFECPLCYIPRRFRELNILMLHLIHGHNLDLNQNDLSKLKYLIVHKQNEISITAAPQKFSRPFTLARCRIKRYLKKDPTPNLDEAEVEFCTENSKARTAGTFTCLKCCFNFENEEDFYKHVKHNHVWTDEEITRLWKSGAEIEEFWCPECASSFMTKSSLKMHLKGSHEFLNDIQLYLERLGYEGEVPMTENQCDICYSIFDGLQEFAQHLRTHGLAFIRRLQLLSKLRNFK